MECLSIHIGPSEFGRSAAYERSAAGDLPGRASALSELRPREVDPISMPQLSIGSMIMAKLVRARFSRLLTVPTLTPVSSAISS
jgi:hypothetical protein